MATLTTFLTQTSDPDTAKARMRQLVRGIVSSRYRQLLVGDMFAFAFVVVLAMTLALFAYRSGWLDQWPALIALAAVSIAALLGIWWRWRQRPKPLDVVVEADIALSLRQQLSTAWEVESADPGSALGGQLAIAAMRERITHRPRAIFPVRLNLWARLTPVMVAVLALVAVIDIGPSVSEDTQTRRARALQDATVSDEGYRLLEFARRMEARAGHEALPRSAEQARLLYRLGSAMGFGDLDRARAVERLTKLGAVMSEAQAGAWRDTVALSDLRTASQVAGARTALRELALDELLRRLASGALSDEDLQRLARDRDALSALGVSPDGLADALDRYRQGDPAGLERLLRRLDNLRKALGDVDELGRAKARIRRSREVLGDESAGTTPSDSPTGSAEFDPEQQGLEGASEDSLTDNLVPNSAGNGIGEGESAWEDPRATGRTDRDLADAKVTLRPQSKTRGVVVYSTATRALPKAGSINAERRALAPQYEAQVEAVLAKEELPLHQKELVRRYFIGLSGQAAPTAGPTTAPSGPPTTETKQ